MPERAIAEQRSVKKGKGHGALLWISVMLHSLLVLLPWAEKSRPSPPPQTPTVPLVAVSQIPDAIVEDAPPLPAVSLAPPAPVAVVVPPADPVAVAASEPVIEPIFDQESNRTIDEPVFDESSNLDDSDSHASGGESQAGDSHDAPNPSGQEATNEAALAAAWDNFLGHVQRQSDERLSKWPLLQIFNVFGEPGKGDLFFDENDMPKVNVSNHQLYPNQTPEQVLQAVIMPGLTNQQSLVIQRQDNFSQGLAYQILQGDTLHYLTIVRLNERNDSVLVLSDTAPSQMSNKL
ncbi:MAG: hypothetical protein AAGB19_14500 [Cyanobacteria bacterium P01_F01_bin.3]